jgi:hypothetical protein
MNVSKWKVFIIFVSRRRLDFMLPKIFWRNTIRYAILRVRELKKSQLTFVKWGHHLMHILTLALFPTAHETPDTHHEEASKLASDRYMHEILIHAHYIHNKSFVENP